MIKPVGAKISISTDDSLNPLLTIERIDLLVSAPEPPTNHCSPLLTEHGTTAFQPLLIKVSVVPGLPSTKRAALPIAIDPALLTENFLVFPSIMRRPTLEFGSPAIAAALL